MFFISLFLVLTLTAAVSGAGLLIMLFVRTVSHKKKERSSLITKLAIFFVIITVANICVIAVSQLRAWTPPIVDDNGSTPANSIAELTELEFNGRKQWVSIRGWDKDKPVLLFLAGGPGGTQMAAVRHELSELEKHFVVVNWDQPGSGKSYRAQKTKNITVDTYVQDGYALTEYLKERFDEEKIYLVGESWGSALGIFLIDKYPQSYHAFIGTGQMIDFEETERLDYKKAIEIAEEKCDTLFIKNLKKKGEPPYYGNKVTFKSAKYLNYLSAYMARNPEISNAGYNTLRDLASPEYGILDKLYFFLGLVNTFNDVYQKLYDIDLREDYTTLDVPVYFFIGRHDINAPTALVEEYERILTAPEKKLIWFEHSGHSPWINERDKFAEEVLSCLLGA